jgi:hypothetical protein
MLRWTCGVLLLSGAGALGCGDGTDSGGGGGTVFIEPGPTCTAFCANVVGQCEAFTFDEASCRQGCEGNLAEERAVSEACGDAVEAVFACVADLDCEGVRAWIDAGLTPVDNPPCLAEVEAVDAAREVDPACAQN